MRLLAAALLGFLTARGVGGNSGRYLRRGFIANDAGAKCWYNQKIDPDSSYFYTNMKATTGIIIFDDQKCMSATGLHRDTNVMMINNIVSRWYGRDDANFKTKAAEMYKTSPSQQKGMCIQSATYPSLAIAVDYVIKAGSITSVIHGISGMGCTK